MNSKQMHLTTTRSGFDINSTVFIVEDDESIRDIITHLVASIGLHAKSFNDPIDFLNAFHSSFEGCLLIDVRMPNMNGLDLYKELKKRHKCTLPIIFISGYSDISIAIRAIKEGAVDFITKPFNNQNLLEKIQHALSLVPTRKTKMQFLKRLEQLTPRQKQVLHYLVEGKTNKEIAFELNISISTTELHRFHLMEKMQVKNTAELIKYYWRAMTLLPDQGSTSS